MHALTTRHTLSLRRLAGLLTAPALAGAALLLLSASVQAAGRGPTPRTAPAQPALSFTVNTTADNPDSNPGDSLCAETGDGKCSLRAAVQELDNQVSGGIIYLPPGTYGLTDDADGDLQLRKNIQIYGTALPVPVIHGGPSWLHRILRVQDGARVLINAVEINGGHVPGLFGGGLAVVSGTVTLLDVTVKDNEAGHGAGIYNAGVLNMVGADIESNVAVTSGGGIYNEAPIGAGPNLTITFSTLANNSGSYEGGGLYNLGWASVSTSAFNGNSAASGGAIANYASGSVSLQGSTLSNNVAFSGDGGGVFNSGAAALLEVINSTVTSNTAHIHGGGLSNWQGSINLSSVTVVANTGNAENTVIGGGGGLYNHDSFPQFILRNTLLARNQELQDFSPDCDGSFSSQAYNLVQRTDGCDLEGNTTGNVTGQDPKLSSFEAHDGETNSWGLQFGSPAIDTGNPTGCRDRHNNILAYDQRGFPFPRSVDGRPRRHGPLRHRRVRAGPLPRRVFAADGALSACRPGALALT